MNQLAIAHLRIIGISPDSLRMDRFSDDYGFSWPELASFVLGLDPNAVEARLTETGTGQDTGQDMRSRHERLPLLGLPAELQGFSEAARAAQLDVAIDRVTSREDVVDSSLHHELGFHRLVLDRLAHTILGKPLDEVFRGSGRRITLAPLGATSKLSKDATS